ncbi:hypothetical protein Bca4012_020673 [Brassica carinata]
MIVCIETLEIAMGLLRSERLLFFNPGRLLGIMDDRTKYIYISLEEMNVVADYIKHQRRVSISHLANK